MKIRLSSGAKQLQLLLCAALTLTMSACKDPKLGKNSSDSKKLQAARTATELRAFVREIDGIPAGAAAEKSFYASLGTYQLKNAAKVGADKSGMCLLYARGSAIHAAFAKNPELEKSPSGKLLLVGQEQPSLCADYFMQVMEDDSDADASQYAFAFYLLGGP